MKQKQVAGRFNALGIRAEALNGSTAYRRRQDVLDAFRRGCVRVLVNVSLFDEGFDVPAVDCVIVARATESFYRLYADDRQRVEASRCGYHY